MFKTARNVTVMTNKYKRLSGIQDEARTQAEIATIARRCDVTSSAVMVLGNDAMRLVDARNPQTTADMAQITKTIGENLAAGRYKYSDGKNDLRQGHSANALAAATQAVLSLHRRQAYELIPE